MKFSAQEEYGLRCLLHIGRLMDGGSSTIPQISRREGISSHNVAKLLRILRQGGYVTSARGQAGGYTLSRSADQIIVGEVLALLGGRLFEYDFCEQHTGMENLCPHNVECTVRSLWSKVQRAVDEVLAKTTLQDLLREELEMNSQLPGPPGHYSKLISLS